MIKKIHKVVMKDRQIKVRKVVEAIGISEWVHDIYEHLCMNRLCARWISLLSLEQKQH